MARITLKDIPENLHEALKREAAANGRSLNREMLVRLRVSVVEHRHRDVGEILSSAAGTRRRFRGSLSQAELDRWRRQGRA